MIDQLLQPVKDYVDGLQTVAELDGVLSHLDMLAVSLRSRRNQGVLFASQIPAEILSEIFQHTVDSELDYRDKSRIKRNLSYPLALLTLRQVCARWRMVTSDFPQLWTTIASDYSRSIIRMMISASASLPLIIRASQESEPFHGRWNDFGNIRLSPADELWGPVLFRLQSLHVCLKYERSEESRTHLLDLDLPALQCLTYHSESDPDQRLTSLLSVVNCFPRLRVLKLVGVEILSIHDGSAASGSHGLATLRIYSSNIRLDCRHALLCIAQCFPRLLALELGLYEWEPIDPVDTRDDSPSVLFPCLGSMILSRLPSSLCMDILGQVTLPAQCHISISVVSEDDQDVLDIPQSLLEFCDAHIRRNVAQHRLYTAEFNAGYREFGQLFALYDAQNGCIFLPRDQEAREWTTETPIIEVILTDVGERVSWSDILWPSIPAFGSVQTLRLLDYWEGETVVQARENWELLQKLFPNICAIGIDFQHMRYYTVAKEYLGDLQTGRPACFPSLQYLVIYHQGDKSYTGEQNLRNNEIFEFIYSCLAIRHDNGHPWRGVEIVWQHCAQDGLPSDGAAETFLKRCARFNPDDISIYYVDAYRMYKRQH